MNPKRISSNNSCRKIYFSSNIILYEFQFTTWCTHHPFLTHLVISLNYLVNCKAIRTEVCTCVFAGFGLLFVCYPLSVTPVLCRYELLWHGGRSFSQWQMASVYSTMTLSIQVRGWGSSTAPSKKPMWPPCWVRANITLGIFSTDRGRSFLYIAVFTI